MMKLFLGVLLFSLSFGCSQPYRSVSKQYHARLDSALLKAGDNRPEIQAALDSCHETMKEGMAFLISWMPERDLKSLKAAYLLENVEYAYKARNTFPWAKEIPDSIFLNEVLPYVVLNETRDSWRKDFYNRFSNRVKDCKTLDEAILAVNKNVRDELQVDYNTRRKRPDQSPTESIELGMASCSGLSILLTDAFRSVGIPSRIAGTAAWHDNRGNHNWCEVWSNGEWLFTEYYFPGQLNYAWFLQDAGKADPADRKHAVYASSYKPTGETFPLVWNRKIDYVYGENVSDRYVRLCNDYNRSIDTAGNHTKLLVMMFRTDRCTYQSDDRVAANVDIFCGAKQIGGGRTAGPTQDMNDVLSFPVEKNQTYTLKYGNAKGEAKEVHVKVGETPVQQKLYME